MDEEKEGARMPPFQLFSLKEEGTELENLLGRPVYFHLLHGCEKGLRAEPVVRMVVGVDDRLHRKGGDFFQLFRNLPRRREAFGRVDDHRSPWSHHQNDVCKSVAYGRIDVIADFDYVDLEAFRYISSASSLSLERG